MESPQRADDWLVATGQAASRSQARMLILEGRVALQDGSVMTKPGRKFASDAGLKVVEPLRYVSRGGEKLEAYLDAFARSPKGKTAIDVGASTGGFPDCLLQRGATHVTCVDVGHSQLHESLLGDPRIENLEKINARTLSEAPLPFNAYELAVLDLSFISLRLILPEVWKILQPGGELVALVKPQFEAPRDVVKKGRGIIRDKKVRQDVLEGIKQFCETKLPAAVICGWLDSPVIGGDGNQEFLLGLRKK